MKATLLLTGSRGIPVGFKVPTFETCFRVHHRSLPLRVIEDLLNQVPAIPSIIAIGGGTVMDAAKALLSLQNKDPHRRLELIPTTFGTGAELTPFATVYADDGRKLSLPLPSSVQVHVHYHPELLHTLPELELRAGFCDAFAHAFESIWANRQTSASIAYACAALSEGVKIARDWGPDVLQRHAQNLQNMGRLAGEAIARGKTTAAHALSYEWTQRFGVPHGFAVIGSLPSLHSLCPRPLHARALGLSDASEVHDFLRQLVQFMLPPALRQNLFNIIRMGRTRAPCPERLENFPRPLDARLLQSIDERTMEDLNSNSCSLFIVEQQGAAANSMRAPPPHKPVDPSLS